MTKKRVFTVLIALVLITTSLFTLTGCSNATYKFYSYVTSGKTYDVGETFYGVTLNQNTVQVKLNNGIVELKINKGFLKGDSSLTNEYETYTGTYNETDMYILALVPELDDGYISIVKTGAMISINPSFLGFYGTLILKK